MIKLTLTGLTQHDDYLLLLRWNKFVLPASRRRRWNAGKRRPLQRDIHIQFLHAQCRCLATQLMQLAALPFSRTPGERPHPGRGPPASLLPPTGPVLADPVAFRNLETHAILECLLFPPISLFFALLKLAWASAFSFPQTPPTLARASSPPTLVLGPSAKEFCGCATAPVPAQRQNRSPAPPTASQSLASAAPCVPTLETRRSPPAPRNRTDPVNRLFEGGPFWNKQPLSWKELGKIPSFFQSRVAVHGVVSQSIQLSTRRCCRALRPVIPKPTPASAPHRAANRLVRFCCPASTTAASRIDTALQHQPHWPLIPPRISRCGRPLSYFNFLFLHGQQEHLTLLVSASAPRSLSRFRRKTLHRGFLHELLIR